MPTDVEINRYGTILFGTKKPGSFRNFIRHRDGDLPALVFTDGSVWYLQNDVKHRDHDKPAVVMANGIKEWYKYGERYSPDANEMKSED